MTNAFEWLPPLITLESFGGDWDKYLEAIYAVFKADFIDSQPSFRGQVVKVRSFPIERGKEAAFWHVISEGATEESRLPAMRRCERLRWIRPCIERSDSAEFKVWENDRRDRTHVCIWLEEAEFLVVLGMRARGFLLESAYPVTFPNRKRALQREYEAYEANAAR